MSEPSPSQGTEALSRRLEELNRQIASTMETAARDVANVGRRATHDLLDAVRRLDSEESQNGILQALLESGRSFASRTAFFLTQGDSFLGWGGQGFGHATSEVAGLEIPFDGPWQSLSRGLGAVSLDAAGCATLAERVGGLAGTEGLLVPFVVRGRLAGAFYADRVSGDGDLAEASLMLLTHSASLAVEVVAFRERGASPALTRSPDDAGGDGVPLWQGETSEPAAASSEAEPEPVVTEPEPVAVEPEPEVEVAAEPEAEPVVEAEPEPEVEVAAEPEPEPEIQVEEPEALVVEPEPEVEAVIEEPAETEIQVEEPEPTFQPIAAEPVAEDAGEPADDGDEPQPFTFETPAVETPAVEPEPVAETEPVVEFETPVFETSDPAPAPEEIEPTEEDLRPEPELEDTSTGIWSLEEAPAVEVEEEDEDEDDEPTAVGEQAVVLDPPELEEVAVDDAADDEPTIVGQQTVRLDLATLQGQATANAQAEPEAAEAVGATDTAAVETPVFQTPEVDTPAVEPGAFDTSSAYVPPPAEPEAPPVAETPPAFTPEPSSAYVPPPADAKPADGGSTQVQPPADHDGPGTAFLASTESDEALHEEARRLARLLVSEIKLYNEEVIEEGRRNHDIYERLKDDIDRSRQMYQERIDPRLQGRDDYFYEELVQRLAGGDASALGMPR